MLAVGDSTRLEIIFHTKRYSRRMIKRPRIQTNEGPPDKYVQIISEIVTRPDSTYPVIVKPYKLDLSQYSDKVVDEITFEIENVSDMDLSVTMIAQPSKLMNITMPEMIKAQSTAEAVIKLTKEGIAEGFEKSFTFELDDEKTSRFTVPVKRTIRLPGDIPGHSAAGQ